MSSFHEDIWRHLSFIHPYVTHADSRMILAKPRPRTELATRPQSASRGTASTREAAPKDTAFAAHVSDKLLLLTVRLGITNQWYQSREKDCLISHVNHMVVQQKLTQEIEASHMLLEICFTPSL